MKNSYKKMTREEMVAKRDALRKEHLDLRMNRVLGHLENPLALRNTRRNIARLNTLIHQQEIGLNQNK